MTPLRVVTARPAQVAIFHPVTGQHTSTYEMLPDGTELAWAQSVRTGKAELWASNGLQWPVILLHGPETAYRDGVVCLREDWWSAGVALRHVDDS